jgi:hypothetical protein
LKGFSPENPVRWGLRGATEEDCPEGENELLVVPVGWLAKEDEKSEFEKPEPEVAVVVVLEVLCECKGVIVLSVVVGDFVSVLPALEKEDATLEISVAPGFRELLPNEKPPKPVNCCCCSCGGCCWGCWGCCC